MAGFARWRRDMYRKFAAGLTQEVWAGDFNIKKLKEKEDAIGIWYANRAAGGELLECLGFKPRTKSGKGWARIKCVDATTICHVCRQKCVWDAKKDLEHTCEHCGATWDQDDNHCRNLLARGIVPGNTP